MNTSITSLWPSRYINFLILSILSTQIYIFASYYENAQPEDNNALYGSTMHALIMGELCHASHKLIYPDGRSMHKQ